MAGVLRFGLVLAGIVLAVDQLTKAWMRALLFDPPQRIEITPFFQLVAVWNRGVSFGMLPVESAWGPWLFVAIAVSISVGLLLWMRRAESRWVAGALGVVVGGAFGNVVDRVRFGAVVDFLDFHVGSLHWPAFNAADTAITIGVAMLVGESLFRQRKSHK